MPVLANAIAARAVPDKFREKARARAPQRLLKTLSESGVREEAIELIRAKGDPAKLPTEEREIVAYAQQLIRTSKVDQATFDALHKRHGTKWLLELTAATGYFGLLCGIVNAFDVPVPEGGERLAGQPQRSR